MVTPALLLSYLTESITYQQFTLRKTAEKLPPKLAESDGSIAACHGYIFATWTDSDGR